MEQSNIKGGNKMIVKNPAFALKFQHALEHIFSEYPKDYNIGFLMLVNCLDLSGPCRPDLVRLLNILYEGLDRDEKTQIERISRKYKDKNFFKNHGIILSKKCLPRKVTIGRALRFIKRIRKSLAPYHHHIEYDWDVHELDLA